METWKFINPCASRALLSPKVFNIPKYPYSYSGYLKGFFNIFSVPVNLGTYQQIIHIFFAVGILVQTFAPVLYESWIHP